MRDEDGLLIENMSYAPYIPITSMHVQSSDTVVDLVLRARQQDIRKQLNRNEVKRRCKAKGAKPKGAKWVLSMQTQCAIIGHEVGPIGVCRFCGAKML